LIRLTPALVVLATLGSCAMPAAQEETSVGVKGRAEANVAPPSGADAIAFDRDELLGQFEPSEHPDFTRIPAAWTDKEEVYLRTEALEAYGRMRAAAQAAGIALLIRSATRNFPYQRGIWERKWERPQYMGWQAVDKARDILAYSAMPGASRHHWGTDIDLNAFENDWFAAGEGATVYAWLQANAADFGFHQVYDDKSSGRTGYELERWHWSYLPIAEPMLAAYNKVIQTADLTDADFSGARTADSLRILPDFVNGVNLPEGQGNTDR
jgi:zinc D-Ala-D-Ala carboxypeptidase